VLQCVVVWCTVSWALRQNVICITCVLQCNAVQCGAMRVLHFVAVCCGVVKCVAMCCSVLQRVAVWCSLLQSVAVCSIVLQCVAVPSQM